jgi:PAS domain S-box-containing protein
MSVPADQRSDRTSRSTSWPLRLTLTIAFAGAGALVLIALGLISYLGLKERLEARLSDDAIRTADRLENTLSGPVWNLDQPQIRQLVEGELLANHDVLWIWVATTSLSAELATRDGSGQVTWTVATSPPHHQEVGQQRSLTHTSPATGAVSVIGSLALASSRDLIDSELAHRRDGIILEVVVMSLVLTLLSAVVVHRVLLRRLNRLLNTLHNAPETAQFAHERGDEVTRLIDGARTLLGRLVAVLDAIGDGVITIDQQGRVQRVNPAARRMLGQATGQHLGDLLGQHHGGATCTAMTLSKVVGAGGSLSDLPIRVGDRQGGERHLLANVDPLRHHEAVSGAVVVLRDVTFTHLASHRLQQAEKLESIGRMAGGVAHDFNNLLTVITISAEMIGDEPSPERRQRHQRAILDAAAQAADFNRKLLAFARKEPIQRTALDLREVVTQAVGLLERTAAGRMRVVARLPDHPLTVEADRAALVNCLINLGVNARDAMPAGGTFTLALTSQADSGGLDCAHGDIPAGPCAVLTAEDHGSGIPSSVINRIFEPFFTTKGIGEGTGLGLAAVYGTMIAHHGALGVASQPGRTVFTLVLPLGQAPAADPAPARTSATWQGTGRILLVDDDPTVRAMGEAALTSLGFSVTACAQGSAALEIFAAEPAGFRLVVLDLQMPDLDGHQVLAGLRAIDPAVRAIFLSGFVGDTAKVHAAGIPTLTKPYRMAELARAIRAALEAPASAPG